MGADESIVNGDADGNGAAYQAADANNRTFLVLASARLMLMRLEKKAGN